MCNVKAKMLAGLLCSVAISNAESFQLNLRTKQVKIFPAADACANSAAPDGFYGVTPDITVRNWEGGTSMKGYLRFKLPYDAAGRIQSVTLSMVRTEPATRELTYHLYGLKPDAPGQQWKEHGGATWNNAPGNDLSSGNTFSDDATGILSSATFDRGEKGDRIQFPGTAEFRNFLNEGGVYVTLMVAQDEDTGSLNRFASRENTTYEAPVLELTYAPNETTRLPRIDAAKKDKTGKKIFDYAEEVYFTPKADLAGGIKYVNSKIPVLTDFSGKDIVLGKFFYNGSIFLKLVNRQSKTAEISFSTYPLNLDVFLQDSDTDGETLLNGIVGFYEYSIPAGETVLLRFSKTGLTDNINIQAKLAARRAVALKTQSPPNLTKDPSTWGAVPIPLDFITSETMWRGTNDLSATAYAMWDDSYFYIGAVVQDDEDIVIPTTQSGQNNSTDNPDREPTDAAIINDILVRDFARLVEGQDSVKMGDKVEFALVEKRISGYNTAKNLVVEKRSRKGGQTFYASAIPWTALKISNPAEGRWLGFSVLTHDYDTERYNIAQWASGVIWRKNSALLGMIYLAGRSDTENAIEKCSDIVSLKWEPAAIGCDEPLNISISGSKAVSQHIKTITVQVLDDAGRVIGTPAVSGSSPWSSVWTPENLPDGKYKIRATLDVKDRIRTAEREILIATEAKEQARRLIDSAASEYAAVYSGRTDETAQRAGQSLENARRLFGLGRFTIAADCAHQVSAWCRIGTYDVPVPAIDSGVVQQTRLTSTPQTVHGVSVWETSTHWCAGNNRIIAKIRKSNMALESGWANGPDNVWQTSNNTADLVFSTPDGKKGIRLADAKVKTAYLSTGENSAGFQIHAGSFSALQGSNAVVKIEVTLFENTDEFTVTLFPSDSTDQNRLISASYPHAQQLDPGAGHSAVIPVYGGCMIPSDWPSTVNLSHDGIFWVAPTWMALIKAERALLFFPETPYDISTRFSHTLGTPSLAAINWQSCWGELRYPRRMRYVLQAEGDHVTVSKRFRQYAIDAGYYRSLNDKIAENPSIEARIGAPVVLTGLYSTLDRVAQGKYNVASWSGRINAAQKLAERSLNKAYVHHTQWTSLFAPGDDGIILYSSYGVYFPPNEAAGGWPGLGNFSQALANQNWVLGLYSNFRDFDPHSPAWNEAWTKKGANGLSVRRRNPVTPSSFISAKEVADNKLVTAYYNEFVTNNISTNALNQIYLDVFAAVPLREDYDPRHPMTREQTAHYQREVMKEARGLGLTVITEHYADWAVPYQDASWQVMPPAYGIAVPVFQMIYGDAIIAPYNITETGDEHWLRCLLFRQVPRIEFFPSDKLLNWVEILCKVHAAVAKEEMVMHRFLDRDKKVQETEFSNGAKIKIDLNRNAYQITGIPGFSGTEQLLPQ